MFETIYLYFMGCNAATHVGILFAATLVLWLSWKFMEYFLRTCELYVLFTKFLMAHFLKKNRGKE